MAHMSKKDWESYQKSINEYHDDANQDDIILKRAIVLSSLNGEDNNIRYKDIELKGLVQYNYFRAWPINQSTDSGENDKESCMVYFNIEYLKSLDLTNEFDQLKFEPSHDRFVIRGITYKSSGESQAAQASTNPLLFFIILKREEVSTGNSKYLP